MSEFVPMYIQLIQKLESLIDDIKHGLGLKGQRDRLQEIWLWSCQVLREADSVDYLDNDINVENWFLMYGEEVLPARFMTDMPDVPLTRKESAYINKKLKAIDGATLNNGTHVFKFVGRKTYKSNGLMNLFACVPIDKEELPDP